MACLMKKKVTVGFVIIVVTQTNREGAAGTQYL